MGGLVGVTPPVQLASRPCLVWKLLAADGQGSVTRWLAAEPGRVLALVLACLWVGMCSGWVGCGVGGPGSTADLPVGVAGS